MEREFGIMVMQFTAHLPEADELWFLPGNVLCTLYRYAGKF